MHTDRRDETPELFKHPVSIDESRLEFERFSVENADVKNFTCGDKDLDDFLTTDEVEFYERENLGTTFLVYYEHELVAYFTISMDSLRREYVKRMTKRDFVKKVEEIPAMKIGRLAVATVRGLASSLSPFPAVQLVSESPLCSSRCVAPSLIA